MCSGTSHLFAHGSPRAPSFPLPLLPPSRAGQSWIQFPLCDQLRHSASWVFTGKGSDYGQHKGKKIGLPSLPPPPNPFLWCTVLEISWVGCTGWHSFHHCESLPWPVTQQRGGKTLSGAAGNSPRSPPVTPSMLTNLATKLLILEFRWLKRKKWKQKKQSQKEDSAVLLKTEGQISTNRLKTKKTPPIEQTRTAGWKLPQQNI